MIVIHDSLQFPVSIYQNSNHRPSGSEMLIEIHNFSSVSSINDKEGSENGWKEGSVITDAITTEFHTKFKLNNVPRVADRAQTI